mmetsp:Transcript_45784/g.90865  ORF Transcript_45784/g.90865 Transcript_45784/m.90865 type:complete len:255 (+) Transcript_45784:706-1470(+)
MTPVAWAAAPPLVVLPLSVLRLLRNACGAIAFRPPMFRTGCCPVWKEGCDMTPVTWAAAAPLAVLPLSPLKLLRDACGALACKEGGDMTPVAWETAAPLAILPLSMLRLLRDACGALAFEFPTSNFRFCASSFITSSILSSFFASFPPPSVLCPSSCSSSVASMLRTLTFSAWIKLLACTLQACVNDCSGSPALVGTAAAQLAWHCSALPHKSLRAPPSVAQADVKNKSIKPGESTAVCAIISISDFQSRCGFC